MRILKLVLRAITTRPFYLLKYIWETFIFTLNYLFWKVVRYSRIKIGRNLHILSFCCFQAERPHATIEVGDDFVAYYKCRISAWGRGRIKIGDCCSFGSGTKIDSRESVSIGNHVLISWDVLISDFNPHPIDPEKRALEMDYSHSIIWPRFSKTSTSNREKFSSTFLTKPIVIEDKVWIGARAIILKGVRIGYGSVVGAGSVLTHDVPPYSIAVGNPAKVVKTLKANEE